MKIVVYTSATCAPCKTLLWWLDKKGISYKTIEGGARVYPTVVYKGVTLEGLNIPALSRLL